MTAEKQRARLAVLAVVDDGEILLAFCAAGHGFDHVIRQVVTHKLRTAGLNLPEPHKLVASRGARKRGVSGVQASVCLAVLALAVARVERVAVAGDQLLDLEIVRRGERRLLRGREEVCGRRQRRARVDRGSWNARRRQRRGIGAARRRDEITLLESPAYRRLDVDIFIMSAGPGELAGFAAHDVPPVGRTSARSAASAPGLSRRDVPIELDEVRLADRAVRRRLDDVIHDVVHGVVRTEPRTARERRKLLAPFRVRPHELAVCGKQIGVVVSVAAAGVERERIPVYELPDFDVVHRRQRHRLRVGFQLSAYDADECCQRHAKDDRPDGLHYKCRHMCSYLMPCPSRAM